MFLIAYRVISVLRYSRRRVGVEASYRSCLFEVGDQLLLSWSKRPLGSLWLIGKAVVVCALMLPRPCVADLPPQLGPCVQAPIPAGGNALRDLHLREVDQDSEDHLQVLARIDLLLRDIDELLVALKGDRASRNVRAASQGNEQIAIFHDLSGTLWHRSVWPVEPIGATADNTVHAAGFLGGSDSIASISSTAPADAAWLFEGAPLSENLSLQAGDRDSAGHRIRGSASVSSRKPESRRVVGGIAGGSQYYLDWPWVIRAGHNMFFWIVGPPASIIFISVALGAVGSSRRS